MKTREAAIQAGKIGIIPVMLTAIATMPGLLPLAVGFNIDFASFFQTWNPHIFFGGDGGILGPLSWTIIFGLIFAFFLTLVMVPSMYIHSGKAAGRWKDFMARSSSPYSDLPDRYFHLRGHHVPRKSPAG